MAHMNRFLFISFFCFLLPATAFAQTEAIFPITDVIPEYPLEAARQQTQGWVSVSFTVTAEGKTSAITVVDAEPAGVFEEAAINAARQFQFEPRIRNGVAEAVHNVGYIFRFGQQAAASSTLVGEKQFVNQQDRPVRTRREERMPSSIPLLEEDMLPVSVANPVYPQQAADDRIAGWVMLRFTVTRVGTVINAQVADSDPAEVFDESALNAIEQFIYEPKLENGRPVDVPDVYYLLKYRPSSFSTNQQL